MKRLISIFVFTFLVIHSYGQTNTFPENGNVGIGLLTPQRKLHVYNDNMIQLRLERPSSGLSDIGSANGALYFWPGGYDSPTGNVIFSTSGNVGIGITSPDYKLDVAGTIRACEVKVNLESGECPDYVFSNDYYLMKLDDLESFIEENNHLPEIKPASEMETEGMDLKDMNIKLLQKMEEMTLYMIDVNKRLEELEKRNKELEEKVKNEQ